VSMVLMVSMAMMVPAVAAATKEGLSGPRLSHRWFVHLLSGRDLLDDPVVGRGERAGEFLVVNAPGVRSRVEVECDLPGIDGRQPQVAAAAVGLSA